MSDAALSRLLTSAACGALLPSAFLGGILLQSESHTLSADRAAFCILLPALLFGLMAFAIWTLKCQRPTGGTPISSMGR